MNQHCLIGMRTAEINDLTNVIFGWRRNGRVRGVVVLALDDQLDRSRVPMKPYRPVRVLVRVLETQDRIEPVLDFPRPVPRADFDMPGRVGRHHSYRVAMIFPNTSRSRSRSIATGKSSSAISVSITGVIPSAIFARLSRQF